MDILLGDFARRHLHSLDELQMQRYEEIVNLEDELLYSYIVGREPVPDGIDVGLIRLIAEFAKNAATKP